VSDTEAMLMGDLVLLETEGRSGAREASRKAASSRRRSTTSAATSPRT